MRVITWLFTKSIYSWAVILSDRCIAMVMIWNQLARGNHDYCAILVVVNSVLQIVLYSPFALLFVNVISGGGSVRVSYGNVAISVLIVS